MRGLKRRRFRRRGSSNVVEINLAAMLDMAFQLLAFFVLTFRPSAIPKRCLRTLKSLICSLKQTNKAALLKSEWE